MGQTGHDSQWTARVSLHTQLRGMRRTSLALSCASYSEVCCVYFTNSVVLLVFHSQKAQILKENLFSAFVISLLTQSELRILHRDSAMAPKVFVVTGANKGIGFETVRKLCQELKGQDAVVILTSRCLEKGKEAIEKLKEEGLTASLEQLDIEDDESVKRFAETLKQKYGEVACLVNNAGFAFKNSATEPVGTQARVTCRINYYGTRDVRQSSKP